MYKSVEKVCIHCNKTFLGSKLRKFCGYECAKNSRKIQIFKKCLECNKNFIVQNWNKKAKYCSFQCKANNQTSKTLDHICSFCKKEFKRKDFKVYKNKSGNSFCSKICSTNFYKGRNHYEWKENLHDKNYKLALKQWGIKIKERDNYICQYCGETDKSILEAHHKKHRCNFPELQFDFNNGVTLCLNCHSLEHKDDPKAFRLINTKIAKARKGK